MPTTVVPGSSTSTSGSVSGPITCGAEPTLQTSSTAPLGMRRWTYGAASRPTCWTQTKEASSRSAGTGERST
jgi:hypothetical protein